MPWQDDATRLIGQVKAAILSRWSSHFDWQVSPSHFEVMRNDPGLDGLEPSEILDLVRKHVRKSGAIRIHPETALERKHKREFFFSVLLEEPGFPREIYVKMVL